MKFIDRFGFLIVMLISGAISGAIIYRVATFILDRIS